MLDKVEELQKRMDRIHELMVASGMSMEELMAESAMVHVDCEKCPIKSLCGQYTYDENIGCSTVWEMYLKGEIDAEKT